MKNDRTLEQLRKLRQRGLSRAEESVARSESGLRAAQSAVTAAKTALDEQQVFARREESMLMAGIVGRALTRSGMDAVQARLDGTAAETRQRRTDITTAEEAEQARAAALENAREELRRRRRKLAKLDVLFEERAARRSQREEGIAEVETEERAAVRAGSGHGPSPER